MNSSFLTFQASQNSVSNYIVSVTSIHFPVTVVFHCSSNTFFLFIIILFHIYSIVHNPTYFTFSPLF